MSDLAGKECPYCHIVDGHTMRCPDAKGSRMGKEPSPYWKHKAFQTYQRNVETHQPLCPNCNGGGIASDGFPCDDCHGTGRGLQVDSTR